MSLTYRSTAKKERVILWKEDNGDKIVTRAVQDTGRNGWALRCELPSGTIIPGYYNGDENTVCVALAKLKMENESRYRQELANGHRRTLARRDHDGIPVAEGYHSTPTIGPIK
jgi:hypothetical protein